MDDWIWDQVEENEWAQFRGDQRSRGRVVLAHGRYTGFFDSSAIDRGDDLEEVQWSVERTTRNRTWLPYFGG